VCLGDAPARGFPAPLPLGADSSVNTRLFPSLQGPSTDVNDLLAALAPAPPVAPPIGPAAPIGGEGGQSGSGGVGRRKVDPEQELLDMLLA